MPEGHWIGLNYKADGFKERVYVNMPYRAHVGLANRLVMWVDPIEGLEDTPGAWSFFARSGKLTMTEDDSAELLAGLYVLLAGHGFDADAMTFKNLAMIARRPQHHIPDKFKKLAAQHLKRQRELERELEREREKGEKMRLRS